MVKTTLAIALCVKSKMSATFSKAKQSFDVIFDRIGLIILISVYVCLPYCDVL